MTFFFYAQTFHQTKFYVTGSLFIKDADVSIFFVQKK